MMEVDMYGNPFKRPNDTTQPSSWMISFADLLSLMLTFFILLFAMSEIRMKEWHEVTSSLQGKLNPGHVAIRFEEEVAEVQPMVEAQRSLNLSYVHRLLEEKLGDRFGKNIIISEWDDRVVLTMKSKALFQPGDASFSQGGLPMVKAVSNAVAKLSNKIEVNGHSDPRPISNKRYPSNWELSLARADAVARLISASGYEKPIEALGMGASRYKVSGGDTQQSLAQARRVDIIIRESKGF